MDRALIIDSFWLAMILNGLKTWEMRSACTKIRGEIGLIEKGTGLIVGKANLVDSLSPLAVDDYFNHVSKHRITRRDGVSDKWRCPWVLEDVVKFDAPIKYNHPKGAVIWVRI